MIAIEPAARRWFWPGLAGLMRCGPAALDDDFSKFEMPDATLHPTEVDVELEGGSISMTTYRARVSRRDHRLNDFRRSISTP